MDGQISNFPRLPFLFALPEDAAGRPRFGGVRFAKTSRRLGGMRAVTKTAQSRCTLWKPWSQHETRSSPIRQPDLGDHPPPPAGKLPPAHFPVRGPADWTVR